MPSIIRDGTISCSELHECIKNVVLLDVRQPEEYIENHFEGCILIPLGELMSRVEDELSGKFSKDADIVIYCAHGIRSMHALMGMKSLGFKNLRSLTGGLAAWEEQYGSEFTSHSIRP